MRRRSFGDEEFGHSSPSIATVWAKRRAQAHMESCYAGKPGRSQDAVGSSAGRSGHRGWRRALGGHSRERRAEGSAECGDEALAAVREHGGSAPTCSPSILLPRDLATSKAPSPAVPAKLRSRSWTAGWPIPPRGGWDSSRRLGRSLPFSPLQLESSSVVSACLLMVGVCAAFGAHPCDWSFASASAATSVDGQKTP